MTRAEHYRAHALAAEQQAERTTDRQAQATLEGVARQWREMARQVERYPLDEDRGDVTWHTRPASTQRRRAVAG